MQESLQLENSVRDTYTQLRSAYDLGGVDENAFKLKPRTASTLNGISAHHIRGSSRDITLLDNGLIVEHVDVRREKKEEKERRRRQEKRERSRPRKSSRGSVVDVTSLYSSHSLAPQTDNSLGPVLSSRYSAVSMRPASSLTVPIEVQPSLGQVYSQASFSDAHSPGSASPRRSRFFGFKNLSSAWRSQDSLAPSGMSGSMIDMQYVSRSYFWRSHGGCVGRVSSVILFPTVWRCNARRTPRIFARQVAREARYPRKGTASCGPRLPTRKRCLQQSLTKNPRRNPRALLRSGNLSREAPLTRTKHHLFLVTLCDLWIAMTMIPRWHHLRHCPIS